LGFRPTVSTHSGQQTFGYSTSTAVGSGTKDSTLFLGFELALNRFSTILPPPPAKSFTIANPESHCYNCISQIQFDNVAIDPTPSH
jgi:hypothetical protein